MQMVENREKETLVPIVYTKCRTGTIIYSDCWASYNKLSKFKDLTNKTVNHSLHFIDPDSGACTNRIESLWNACKHKFKEMHGCNRIYIQSYIDEYMWRFNNHVTKDRVASYVLIMKDIGKFYRPGTDLENFQSRVGETRDLTDEEDEDYSLTDVELNFSFAESSNEGSDVLGSLTNEENNLIDFDEDDEELCES